MKFSIFAPRDKTFSNGFHSAMVDFNSKKFLKSIFTEENKIYSENKKHGKVILAEYDSKQRAEEIKNELLNAYKKNQSDYFLPERWKKIKFRLAGIVNDSTVDGLGLRLTVFVQGCPHHCEGCHNQHTWDFGGGYEEDTEKIIEMFKKNSLLKGVTLSGGEPFEQAQAMYLTASEIHKLKGDIWTYTGYTLEELQNNPNKFVQKLLDETDFLVDGKFEQDKKDLSLNFRGSRNQRIFQKKNNQWILIADGKDD